MSNALNTHDLPPVRRLSPEEVAQVIQRARAAQAEAIRSAIASLFHWHRREPVKASTSRLHSCG
jgi:hypothetical protein